MNTTVRALDIELTADEARYILHSLSEFKEACKKKVEADEEGDDDITHMFANDIMQAKMVFEKIEKAALVVLYQVGLCALQA